jgi:hypothetical protein
VTTSPAPNRVPDCAANPSLPASAWCTSCGQPFNGRFLDLRDDGRAICFSCAAREPVALLQRSPRSGVDPALDGGWLATLRRVLLFPARTLASQRSADPWPVVRLGLVWTFIGYAGSTAWTYVLRYDDVMRWLGESGATTVPPHVLPWIPWLGLPMAVVVRFAAGVGLLHFGLRMSMSDAAPFRAHLRAFSLSSIALVFGLLPVFGPSLGVVVQFVVLLTWARATYRLPLVRALFALSPWLVAAVLFDVAGGL